MPVPPDAEPLFDPVCTIQGGTMLTAQLATLLLAVSSTGDTMLLDFRADWCGPCRQMDPVVQQLTAAGYPVRQVNIDQQRELAAKFRVESIPCFVLVVDGHEVDRTVGATDGGTLVGLFRRAGYDPAARLAGGESKRGRADPDKEFPAEVSQAPLRAVGAVAPDGKMATVPGGFGGTSAASWIATCVRLKVTDPKGNSVGSGTIIDARQGEALILTCGHIFRDSEGKGAIFVDLFGQGAPQHVAGRLLGCDLERDVAIVGIAVKGPVAVARVAPPNYAVHKGDRVVGIGCSNGAEPTVQESHVNSLDRFRGPPNIEVAGQPVQGRSGGGLFNAQGQVIGVCNAADPSDDEGMFAAPASIYKELDRAGLTFVYTTRPRASVSSVEPDPGLAAREVETANADLPAMPSKMPSAGIGPTATGLKRPLTPEEAAALAELREKARGAEVICIVRPLANPDAKSEIIVLDKASKQFLDQLAIEQNGQSSRQLTSLETPRERPPCAVPSR
jgi:thiol-disulfide isomerase/thioredoxin